MAPPDLIGVSYVFSAALTMLLFGPDAVYRLNISTIRSARLYPICDRAIEPIGDRIEIVTPIGLVSDMGKLRLSLLRML